MSCHSMITRVGPFLLLLLCACINADNSDEGESSLLSLLQDNNFLDSLGSPADDLSSTSKPDEDESAGPEAECPAKSHCAKRLNRRYVSCLERHCGECLAGYAVTAQQHRRDKKKDDKETVCYKILSAQKKGNIFSSFLMPDEDLNGLKNSLKQRDVPVAKTVDVKKYSDSTINLKKKYKKKSNFVVILLVVLLAVFVFALIFVLLMLCWCGCFDSKPKEKLVPNVGETPMDRKLAQSAQVYHFQHEKQRIIAEEQEQARDPSKHRPESEDEQGGEPRNMVVLEFSGPAAQNQNEVHNPLFRGPTPSTEAPTRPAADPFNYPPLPPYQP